MASIRQASPFVWRDVFLSEDSRFDGLQAVPQQFELVTTDLAELAERVFAHLNPGLNLLWREIWCRIGIKYGSHQAVCTFDHTRR